MGVFTQLNRLQCPFSWHYGAFPTQIIACCAYRCPIYVFHTQFDRGLNLRLFCSPHWDSPPSNTSFDPLSTTWTDCCAPKLHTLPKRRFWKAERTVPNPSIDQIYAPQTKVLEGCTKIKSGFFDCLFNGSYPLKSAAKIRISSFVHPSKIFGGINFMLPKRRFWKEEQKMKSGFSTDFSMVRSQNRVLTPLKSASKILISSFVPPSKIFVWDG